MLTRIVKMHFATDFCAHFEQLFKDTRPFIQGFEGCEGLKLLRDDTEANVFFTISLWQSAEHLEKYRHSDVFKTTWATVKPHFLSKAEAWSLKDVSQ